MHLILIEVWRGACRDRVLREVLHRGSQKVDLARAILDGAATEWWFAPLDIGQQLYVPRDRNLPDPDQLIAPDTPLRVVNATLRGMREDSSHPH